LPDLIRRGDPDRCLLSKRDPTNSRPAGRRGARAKTSDAGRTRSMAREAKGPRSGRVIPYPMHQLRNSEVPNQTEQQDLQLPSEHFSVTRTAPPMSVRERLPNSIQMPNEEALEPLQIGVASDFQHIGVMPRDLKQLFGRIGCLKISLRVMKPDERIRPAVDD
jgi:hypothetical protein